MYKSGELAWCCFGVLTAIFLRLCTTLHPYSGQGKRPMYGDYEAQRHWMEITVNLPMNQWYHNSTSNNLEYWGLDYPPLTAYHSYVLGLIAYLINPEYVELETSRGFESEDHKIFMRYTVLISDFFIYIPAVVMFFFVTRQIQDSTSKSDEFPLHSSIITALLYPGLILIDHGHFQYNCISLGFAVVAVTCLFIKSEIFASIFFCLALNYKQMELYHAFPFFLYLLSACIPKPGEHAINGILKLAKLAITVLAMFGLLWLPFIFDLKDLLQVVHRLFPLARGLFEDKVANVWCALNVFYKFKKYCSLQMVRYCTVATLTAILPSSADLFLRPNVQKFIPALINSSLAFFLFSYQVHEKSILLAAIPAVLYLPQDPLSTFWFLTITNFSMLPLYIKDNLIIAYVALTLFYSVAFIYSHERWGIDANSENTFYKFYVEVLEILLGTQYNKRSYSDVISVAFTHFVENRRVLKKLIVYTAMLASLLGCIILMFVILVFDAPESYPDLYTLLISVYSCVHFVGFFVYFNVVQFKIPQSFDGVHIKLKQN